MSVLGLVALSGEVTGYDLRKLGDGQMRYFLGLPSPAQIYASLAELHDAGFLAERLELTGRRERRVYSASESGMALIRGWLEEDAPEASFDFPLGLRMMLGRHGGHDALVRSIETHRDICDLVIETIEAAQAGMDDDPYMATMLEWGHGFFTTEAERTTRALARLEAIPPDRRR